ncbi:hypothetical protein [Bergeyella zoohelcum]|uniref:Transferrin-binding protein B C-lobe/N-lobe beta barrel domain-containing protein n=1 Tax=Bergeyella zoohelcum ATCC 43767 TaxID=883096 RepID=K1LPK4_9FLAO|nr:hypothetical protein [Bergeyella zoohelcum]EKB58890.1 hypothetical protein HMPREF9699_00435 [Bergeyella zoohelcum ATCC 43767]SUV49377.1 Uncharacterised protein [Bergeyella zoohelcum]
MNKTTIKISVLAFLGFMTYGYAQQQQQDPYKGKVGVNTIAPSATMDVQPNSDNARAEAKTNEGIIAPKLSKTRIANIATPVEGTLVYATDETTSPISAYTGGDTKVAKITEKGYYYYNGTEWVKAGNNSPAVDGSKWTNDTANNVVKLANLSNGTTSRTDDKNVFINNEGNIGIGQAQPVYALDIERSGTLGGNTDYAYGSMRLLRYRDNGSMGVDFYRARGTKENPLEVQDRDGLGTLAFYGYDGTQFRTAGSMSFNVAGTPTGGLVPVKFNISFRNQASGGNMSNGYNSVFSILPNGHTGIGVFNPTERLDVAGKIKSSALSGTGDRVVVADQNGVLKTSQFVMKATDTSSSCSQENAGAIHYKEIDKGGKMVGVFGFCTRDTQGNYKWAYNMGGANMLDGTGAFGSGL